MPSNGGETRVDGLEEKGRGPRQEILVFGEAGHSAGQAGQAATMAGGHTERARP